MPTQTGTASTSADLLIKLNTFITANGWTRLRGETDTDCASPKAARYWRILVYEIDNTFRDIRQIAQLEWRTTTGGANQATNNANYDFSNINGTHDLVGGTDNATSFDIDDDIWWVSYDFGSDTIIREIHMTIGDDLYAPADFAVQFSNDNLVWTTIAEFPYDDSRFTADGQSFTFTWDTGSGYREPIHPADDEPRRGGLSFYKAGNEKTRFNESCDNIWCWQGPGFDAARRVYISAVTFYDLVSQSEFISFGGSIDVDTSMPAASWFQDQLGEIAKQPDVDRPTHVMSSLGVTYWFYCNSKRIIIVTKNGVDDYTMSYIGFMSQFALPDDYPFPLYIGGCTHTVNDGLTNLGTIVRDAQDPSSDGSAYVRHFDNTWKIVRNHSDDSGDTVSWTPSTDVVIHPKHTGVVGRVDFPFSLMGDSAFRDTHFLDRLDPTVQGDLPVFPCTVFDVTDGFLGALDGLYVVPQGGVLSPEATFTISGDTYRVFRTRSYSEPGQYYCIKEV